MLQLTDCNLAQHISFLRAAPGIQDKKHFVFALDVGKIFYAEKKVSAYSTLGIGRLIYQLPINR